MNQHERLKQVRKEFNLTQTEAGDIIGMSQAGWAKAEAGKSNLSRGKMETLAKALKVNYVWLETGIGGMRSEADELEKSGKKSIKKISSAILSKLTSKKELSEEDIQDIIYLPGIESPDPVYAITINDRSMEPTIVENGTIVLEAMADISEFQDGKIYVLIIGKIPLVKRVNLIISGKDSGKFKISNEDGKGEQVVDRKEIKRWYRVIYVINPV